MRGAGESEGYLSDEYTEQSRNDAVEVIEWLAQQPWCTGAVGMYGLSWGGYNGIQLATIAPEPLKAIAVAGATDDRFCNDTHFLGGVMASEHPGWAVTLLSFLTRPPDPQLVGDRWESMWIDRLSRLESVLPLWLRHPVRDSYWTDGFPRDDPHGLRVPTLLAGGFYDVYVNAILRMVARQPDLVKGVIGPWGHHFPHRSLPEPNINWLHQCDRWFGRYLKQERTDVESDPPLRLFVTESFVANGRSEENRDGRWIAIGSETLRQGDIASYGVGDFGRLATTPSKQPRSITIDSPATLGTAGGEFMPMGWGIDLPSEQRSDDALSVCFETEPLAHAIEVIGTPLLTLAVTSSAPTGFLVARLCDVAPNGNSTRISIGAHELSTNGGSQPHAPLSPQESVRLEIELGGIAHRFAAGQRIRLALSNAYWPMLWPSNQDGVLAFDSTDLALTLPTPRDLEAWTFPTGDGEEPHPKTVLEPPVFERELVREMPDGMATYRIADVSPRVRFDDHGIESCNATTRIYEIDEDSPDTASMRIERDIEVRRGDWLTSTHVVAVLRSDATNFYTDISLVAKRGDDAVIHRTFDDVTRRFPEPPRTEA